MNPFLEPYKFTYKNKEYDLHKIIGPENIYMSNEFGKPIIIKGGIAKLCSYFEFKDFVYDITWKDVPQPLGIVCSVMITMASITMASNDTVTEKRSTFIGDGEANLMNCKGIAAAHMQAMAIKRARSRAVLQELGIDAYGEEEAQDFEEKVPAQKAIKTFLASEIKNLANRLASPLDIETLRDEIRQFFNLSPEDAFTVDNLDSSKLIEFYGKLYVRLNSQK